MTVERLTIHHRGVGEPNDNLQPLSKGGYSAAIGVKTYQVFRPPEDSWATKNFNGKSFDVCFSGNRNNFPITDKDLDLLTQCCNDARSRDWIGQPTVFPHGTIHPVPPGYPQGNRPTECPGTGTVARWPAVVSACAGAPLPTGKVVPVQIAAHPNGGYYIVRTNGAVHPFDAPFHGDLSATQLAAPIISMAVTEDGGGYWLLGEDGGVFAFGNATFHGRI